MKFPVLLPQFLILAQTYKAECVKLSSRITSITIKFKKNIAKLRCLPGNVKSRDHSCEWQTKTTNQSERQISMKNIRAERGHNIPTSKTGI